MGGVCVDRKGDIAMLWLSVTRLCRVQPTLQKDLVQREGKSNHMQQAATTLRTRSQTGALWCRPQPRATQICRPTLLFSGVQFAGQSVQPYFGWVEERQEGSSYKVGTLETPRVSDVYLLLFYCCDKAPCPRKCK